MCQIFSEMQKKENCKPALGVKSGWAQRARRQDSSCLACEKCRDSRQLSRVPSADANPQIGADEIDGRRRRPDCPNVLVACNILQAA